MQKRFNVFTPRGRELRAAYKQAKEVEALKDKYRAMSNEELSSRTNFFLSELKRGVSLDGILPDALATAREAIYRVHGLYAYPVQVIGAIVIHKGNLAEMYTGEGKTLTIILTAYLNALTKKGVHVVTVNEYLVKRDALFCAQALNPLGITVGYNVADMDSETKRQMFACDITYTTNSELGFDYLRDNMVKEYSDKVIRDLNMAIIDEVDSVLIDESRTPLIISGQPKKDVSLYIDVDRFVKTLTKDDYIIDDETNTISLNDSGVEKTEKYFKIKNLYNIENSDLVHKIRNSLMANFVFRYGVEYIVRDNKIMLVDHFTGRILEGRSYNAGLHQAIQAKEMVKIDPENVIVATITYQAFFRLYKKLSGVTGTALTEADEFIKIYNMIVVPVPTNRKVIRRDLPDYVFETKTAKWAHVAAEIERLHTKGQPVLVGTASVEDSEELAALLRNKGLKFELLNAKNHAREAEIVALAGQRGAITISTNMAGRGTDIKLGPGVKELGGLFVIGTNRHESRRVDNQLCGRSGRQGDPGMTRFFISTEDPLFKRFGIDKKEKTEKKVTDQEFYDSWFFNRMVKMMQKKVEGLNFDTRKNLTDYDVVLSNQREVVYKQRDQILKNERNIPIIRNMINIVAKDLVNIFLSKENPNYVDETKLAQAINLRLLGFDAIEPSLFAKQNVQTVTALVTRIIWGSIEARIATYNPEQIQRVLKSIIIQNFDAEWTTHLDVMSKIREGVTLRSLEQKSPLNIYVEEADKHFTTLKKNVAHKVVISIHRLYIPNIAATINDRLHDSKLISDKHYAELKTKFSTEANKNIRIDFADLIRQKANAQKAPAQWSAKEKLIKQQDADRPTIKAEEKKQESSSTNKIVER
ncbi:MAG: preprotein translocase subunit SecA [Mycoplasma sp.]|nr:preprotein translocase subunit SecA [Candidatus Hennigella equi]